MNIQMLLSSVAAVVVLFFSPGPYQHQRLNYTTEAGIDTDGNIYASSDAGKPIKMAAPGHCMEARFADDKQTVGCSVARGTKVEDVSQSMRLEIYLRNGQTSVIETGTTIAEWHFWRNGQQVSIYLLSSDGKGRHLLYDAATASLVEDLPEPSDESLLPEWAKGPAQLQDESVPTGEAYAREQTKWVAKVLRQVTKVQPGMKREDLLKVFTTEGGLSTRLQRTYVYSECPYIKVDVRFKASDKEHDALVENPDDVIEAISRPYLAWSVMD